MVERSLGADRASLLVEFGNHKAFKLSTRHTAPFTKNSLQNPLVEKVHLGRLGQPFGLVAMPSRNLQSLITQYKIAKITLNRLDIHSHLQGCGRGVSRRPGS